MLHRLAALRESVVSRVRTAEQQHDVEALRCALAQTFETVLLRADGTVSGFDPRADMRLEGGEWHGSVRLPLEPRHTLSGSGVPE